MWIGTRSDEFQTDIACVGERKRHLCEQRVGQIEMDDQEKCSQMLNAGMLAPINFNKL